METTSIPATETRATGTIDEHDALTGVRGYYTLLRDFDYAAYAGRETYVVLCDIDNFRMFNDAYGENHCNNVLAEIGRTLQDCFGESHVFRYGSDEFIVVDSFDDSATFNEKIEDLNRRIGLIAVEGEALHISFSYGCVHGKLNTSDDLHEAIRLADRKMYEAKRIGKARLVSVALDGAMTMGEGRRHLVGQKVYELDELTGLANLFFFRKELGHMLAKQVAAEPVPDEDRLALIHFDIQNFKAYNQQFGFEAGDELLILVADAIEKTFRGSLAARFSADQFMVATKKSLVKDGFHQVRKAFRSRHKDTSIWLRAGVNVPDGEYDDVGLNMDRAKMACDSIKGRRDKLLRFYDAELKAQILAHRYVLENIDRAISEGWVRPYYQPIARVATNEVCDVEALARWEDPERGIISPADFIPVLEDARLIHTLDLHIVRCVCRDLKQLMNEGRQIGTPSINLSRFDFELCDIVASIIDIVDEFDIPHSNIAIEVTESALSGNQFLKADIDRFRDAGFEVWMDDFGSGYSSLSLLKEYNFDLIKIDMVFLREFDTNEYARVVLAHVINMSKELGLKTLVEGVETEEQFKFLKSIGCGRAQGWHFGRPVSFDGTLEAITNQTYPPVESLSMRSFYEAIGRTNMVRPNPSKAPGGGYTPSDIPAVIIERRHGEFKFLNVSDVYLTFLHDMGVSSVEETEENMTCGEPSYKRLRASIEDAVASEGWVRSTYDDLGFPCSLVMKCIARNLEEDAISVIVVTLDGYGSVREG